MQCSCSSVVSCLKHAVTMSFTVAATKKQWLSSLEAVFSLSFLMSQVLSCVSCLHIIITDKNVFVYNCNRSMKLGNLGSAPLFFTLHLFSLCLISVYHSQLCYCGSCYEVITVFILNCANFLILSITYLKQHVLGVHHDSYICVQSDYVMINFHFSAATLSVNFFSC